MHKSSNARHSQAPIRSSPSQPAALQHTTKQINTPDSPSYFCCSFLVIPVLMLTLALTVSSIHAWVALGPSNGARGPSSAKIVVRDLSMPAGTVTAGYVPITRLSLLTSWIFTLRNSTHSNVTHHLAHSRPITNKFLNITRTKGIPGLGDHDIILVNADLRPTR